MFRLPNLGSSILVSTFSPTLSLLVYYVQDTVSRFQCPCFYLLSNPVFIRLLCLGYEVLKDPWCPCFYLLSNRVFSRLPCLEYGVQDSVSLFLNLLSNLIFQYNFFVYKTKSRLQCPCFYLLSNRVFIRLLCLGH